MKCKAKIIILSIFLVLMSSEVFGQIHPPEPRMEDTMSAVPGEGCIDPDGDGPLSPPPGLCMPIDNYFIYLLIGGLGYGVYITYKLRNI